MILNKVTITEQELKNANIISPFERQLSDGSIVQVNSGGSLSNRLLSCSASYVKRNGWNFSFKKNACRAFFNLSMRPLNYMDDDKVSVGINLTLALNDLKTKTNYLIPVNIGMLATMILMRERLDVTKSRDLKDDFMNKGFDERFSITKKYIDMISDKGSPKFYVLDS